MFGMVYLILNTLLGREFAVGLFGEKAGKTPYGNRIWVILPASFGIGTLLVTWAVYMVSWMAGAVSGAADPLYYGNVLVLGAVCLGLFSAITGVGKPDGRFWAVKKRSLITGYSEKNVSFLPCCACF